MSSTINASTASGGGVITSADASGVLALQTGGTTAVTIDASQNVGIGTSSPAAKLDVIGTQWVRGGTATGAIAIINADATSGANGISLSASFVAGGYGPIVFNTSNAEAMRISAAGSVGIGTTAPNASAILDAQSTTKGVRFPNMTTTQKTAISSPAAGLVVFDTTLAKLCVYSGAAWQTITSV